MSAGALVAAGVLKSAGVLVAVGDGQRSADEVQGAAAPMLASYPP